jgi:hydrogenase maturation protease
MPVAKRAPFAVIGVGNALLGDDGFGPSTLRLLESRWRWPAKVELVDVGTGGFDLVHALLGRERVILLDATVGPAPGALVQLDHAALLAVRPGAASPHEPSIGDALQLARLTGTLPNELSLFGVVPVSLALGVELTAAAQAACAEAAELVVARVREWGVTVERSASPGDACWWRVMEGVGGAS